MSRLSAALFALFLCAAPGIALAQTPAAPAAAQPQLPPPPPPGGAPVLRSLELRFHPENQSMVDIQTYFYYLQTRPISADNKYQPYDEAALLADFRRLWSTGFLDNLWIEVLDDPFDNGAPAKRVIFHMEERQRVKIVDYEPHKIVDSSKIEEELRKRSIAIRLDSFLDQNTIKKVSAAIRDLYAEKGYQYTEVTPSVEPMPTGPKLVHLTFNVTPGPKVKIEKVDFVGNKAFSDGKLEGQMKSNKGRSWLSFITGAGTFQEAKFDEDADRIVSFYRDHGYTFARVGQPQLEVIKDSPDKTSRYVTLKIPVDEGDQYRVGKISFEGNKVVKTELLAPLLKLKEGDVYEEKTVRKWYEKTKEIYGGAGYMEFQALPDLDARCLDETTLKPDPNCSPEDQKKHIVDLTLRMQEGSQYFVNRITFSGNTTTHDEVARREMNLLENGIFNSESLKYSIRRLNQLGYFKPIEAGSDAVQVSKTPNSTNKVDIKLKVEEQNRNQLSFGAGISQLDGFFGQLGFQTANFLGRGETVSVNAQKGYRANNYEVAITEPFLFGRPITTGVNLFTRQLNYINEFTQDTKGATATLGLPSGAWGRFYFSYSFQQVKVYDVNAAYLQPSVIAQNPYLADSLLVNDGGRRTVSKISPSYVHSTINEPIFPTDGHKYTFGFDFAGLGGDTQYVTTSAELIHYFKFTNRTSLGLRVQGQYIRPYGDTQRLPIFEKIFLGGEYSIRGTDLRAVGPRDESTGLVTGGNKNLLFNAEYMVTIAGPVRLLAFFDAGQVRDVGDPFGWKEPVYKVTANTTTAPLLYDPNILQILTKDNTATTTTKTLIGYRDAFKTSTGLELRFFMPVVNVPFRLIGAWNPSRGGVLDNNLVALSRFTFRFAVGTTF